MYIKYSYLLTKRHNNTKSKSNNKIAITPPIAKAYNSVPCTLFEGASSPDNPSAAFKYAAETFNNLFLKYLILILFHCSY